MILGRRSAVSRSWFWRRTSVAVAIGALALGSATAPLEAGATTAHASSTLRVPWSPNVVATSVFPFYTAATCIQQNLVYWYLQVRPAYWIGLGRNTQVQYQMSPLAPPVFGMVNGDRTITLTVKGWQWSDGAGHTEKMTARDVVFWLNMDRAQEHQGVNASCTDVPGVGIPEKLLSVTTPDGLNGSKLVLRIAGKAGEGWLLDNELSGMVPMPIAWDVTSSGADPGSGGCSAEAWSAVATDGTDPCSKVFLHLSGLLANDPAWDWADGPYRQTAFGYNSGIPDGNDVQVANVDYSGPSTTAAHAVTTIQWVPFTSVDAEILALQANQLDTGYVYPNDVGPSPGAGRAGANLLPSLSQYVTVGSGSWGVSYWDFNFDTRFSDYHTRGSPPTWARLNNQLYVRGAVAESIDQPALIRHVDNGYAVPGWSAIPTYPKSPYTAGLVNPYPYSRSRARAVMAAHGWDTHVFPAICGRSNCGSSAYPIVRGTRAMETAVALGTGSTTLTDFNQDVVNEVAAGADIQIKLHYETYADVDTTCFVGSRPWAMCAFGGWIYSPDYYPSGEGFLSPGTSSNIGGYDDPTMNCLIHATTNTGNYALNQYDPRCRASYGEYTATHLPLLWMPQPTGFSEQRASMTGAEPSNPLGWFNPEYVTSI
jgi:peptide/nickel transport system substrate-binding protein